MSPVRHHAPRRCGLRSISPFRCKLEAHSSAGGGARGIRGVGRGTDFANTLQSMSFMLLLDHAYASFTTATTEESARLLCRCPKTQLPWLSPVPHKEEVTYER